ncbi:MAG TPA: rhodanese-like domain-containing protein [Thermoanaerobaculia bacterium]|nr:rhodanese-like domain-containing protein [Thermoanaerobaculia bacterium]
MRLMIHTLVSLLLAIVLAGCRSESTSQVATEQTPLTPPTATQLPPPPVMPSEPLATATDTARQPATTTAQVPQSPIIITQNQKQAAAPLVPMETALAEIPRIDPDELKRHVDQGNVVIIDVRGPSYYTKHIRGALDITETQLPFRMSELPRDKKIVTYCT